MKQLLIATACTLACAGCSDPTKGIVSGTVKINGELANSGSIAFFPTDGKSPTSGGMIREDGTYEATVGVGMSRVEIRVSEVVGTQKLYDTPDSETMDIREEILPRKYNDESELTYEVPSGKSEKHFELERLKRRKR